jgi:GTP-binding protein
MSKPIVAIVGKQNVGKSTLLNRIAGKPLAIVEDEPGTTRDRVFAEASWRGVSFTLVDTGGLELQPRSTVARGVREQIEAAISEADAIIFVVDVREGVTPPDLEMAARLRRAGKPVLVAANKADNARREAEAVEFYELGLGEVLPVSAHHGRGVGELLDSLVPRLPPPTPEEAGTEAIRVAIVGRPNVGKSMLLNAMVGEKRSIVDVLPGTTRDALDTLFDFQGQNVLLIDTAGIRRRGKVTSGIEQYSVIRALRAIDRADVALLVLDATEPATTQDTHIAGYIQQAAKGIVLIMNKWDLVENKNTTEWNRRIKSQFNFVAYAPVLYTSAKTGQGVDRIMPQVQQVYQERAKRLTTARVNDVIQQAFAAHTRPRSGRRQLNILYATQAEANPPTFVIFANDTRLIHFSYRRYLENQLRAAFGFTGTPLRLIFKTRGEE